MSFIRYVAVQLVAYGLDMGTFVLMLASSGAGPLLANVSGKVVAGLFAFVVHRRFTFEAASSSRQGPQAVMYGLLLAFNIPLSSAVLSVVLLALPLPVAAKFLSDVICVFITYWLSRKYVFVGGRNRASEAAGPGTGRP